MNKTQLNEDRYEKGNTTQLTKVIECIMNQIYFQFSKHLYEKKRRNFNRMSHFRHLIRNFVQHMRTSN